VEAGCRKSISKMGDDTLHLPRKCAGFSTTPNERDFESDTALPNLRRYSAPRLIPRLKRAAAGSVMVAAEEPPKINSIKMASAKSPSLWIGYDQCRAATNCFTSAWIYPSHFRSHCAFLALFCATSLHGRSGEDIDILLVQPLHRQTALNAPRSLSSCDRPLS
jgi:hypothetical protein